jgi:hypothetical protein
MKIIEIKRLAKMALNDYGVKLNIKDMKKVTINRLNYSEGFAHRRIFLVETINGKRIEILSETVDANGDFSLGSAKFVTRDVRIEG